ncbi:helicase-related protein [Aeoliella mucimassa]|uniref:RNA polymerase-associated protein RapA n=1 Tax=Aeoliella mucimassa TaxID=2527972 RepID=A0A518APT4_9BACT|nr:helicase-related protein [Aeoliella mucimassa]QDU56728.1 RNA polymerase-associated protein RapA [Aeoliella mucimassa]
MSTTFPPGALVKARGREWVVLPDSGDEVLLVRPIGGLDDEVVGICRAIEPVDSASFSLPDPTKPGDFNSCRLLRDAARLSTRSAAGPFRSFGKIAVDPRPYQLVPLLMAMRLDPVRLLIADDVGIGKTVESCLIAKELLERGEVTRLAVLCPPHLAEQWQKEMAEKFHIDAELVLSSTVQRLERGLQPGESIYQRYRHIIVSTDFIKSHRRRDDFIRECPELVIVDEAHTCTLTGRVGQARQARHELIKAVSESDDRNLILVTATPHSGNEDAFRSLLSLIDPKFRELPHDLESDSRSSVRAELAKHLVQRLRGNVIEMDKKLETDTSFPEREDAEESYKLSEPYKKLFRKVLDFASELVSDESGSKKNHRVRWWSALALLRAMASSPAAAAATLRNRAATADAEDEADVEELGRRAVLDQEELEITEVFDMTPGGAPADAEETATSERLKRLAREAEKLSGKDDAKLQKAIKLIKKIVKDGYNPIIFCRFIDTADYIAAQLRDALGKVEVASVTGTLPPKEREDRIEKLGEHEQRVLVCTDCLSEGVNLQTLFDAVVHYDLSWNPTRHEQREGRVDRFGQSKDKVRVLTYFGVDNQIDGVVLDVLLRKHKKIKSDLGISVAVPGSSEEVIKALFEGMELRGGSEPTQQLFLPGLDPIKSELHAKWEDARETEKRSRSRFAQHAIKTEEVKAELDAIREAIGAGPTVQRFVHDVLHLAGVPLSQKPKECVQVAVSNETPRALRHAIGRDNDFLGRFDLPVDEGVLYLSRTHPIVEGLASYTLETALDDVQAEGERVIARRCGVTRTDGVTEKTSLLVVRLRYHLKVKRRSTTSTETQDAPLLAEEVLTLAFTGSPSEPQWLSEEESKSLLDMKPTGNLPENLVKQQLDRFIGTVDSLRDRLDDVVTSRSEALKDAHTRIRKSAKMTGSVEVTPTGEVDILGCFILLPEEN